MLTKATFQNFTTVPNTEWKFAPGLNVIVGENGLGKSHVLKAIYSLLKVQSGKEMSKAALEKAYAEGGVAWLIEVKDYRQHTRSKAMELPEDIAIKVRDTVAGLVSARCAANDADEKRCARADPRQLHPRGLPLGTTGKALQLHPRGAIAPSDLQQKLKMLIKVIDPHPSVVDMHSLHPSMTWRVA